MPPPEFLSTLFWRYEAGSVEGRPWVTVTFAQSVDGKIGAAGGRAIALSGEESMRMTHWMRTMHDGILVGIGTAMGDDPQLNTRHVPDGEAPRPIVLDSGLRMAVGCKLLRNYGLGTGKQPWVVGVEPREDKEGWEARRAALEGAGARVLVNSEGIDGVLRMLRREGIERLMVEGGGRVIASFIDKADTLLITTAPVLVGADGVGWQVGSVSGFDAVESRLVGEDMVVAFSRLI